MPFRQSIAAGMLHAIGLPLLIALFAREGQAAGAKLIDMTYTFDPKTIYWPTEASFHREFEYFGEVPEGYFYSSGKFAAPEHGGTHMDAPLHFSRSGLSAEQVPLAECIGPAVVIDFSARASSDRDAMLLPADVTRYEGTYGKIPQGAIVVAHSGWGRFWSDKKRYLGTDKPRDLAGLRFPDYSKESVELLLERRVAAIAIDTASIDPGNSKDFPVHRLWLGANHPAFENLANAEKLPAKGATLYCIPMKIGQGTGAPARVFAVLP